MVELTQIGEVGMTRSDYTAIMLLVDRSSSMRLIRKAAESSINEFLNEQRQAGGYRTVRIAQFNHEYSTVCTSRDPSQIETFLLEPSGTTALLDAMGKAMVEFGEELSALPEAKRPGTVICAVMTDGEENCSREYTWPHVKEMVERQERDYNWQVLYLGANQDAIEVAAKLGVTSSRAMTYAATDWGFDSATRSLASYVDGAASGAPAAFTDEQRRDARLIDENASSQ